MTVSQLTGKPIADALTLERGRLVDMMLDSPHGCMAKIRPLRRSRFRDGLTRFLLELGCEPTVILSHNANKRWQRR